jgi:hypothetical protein
MNRRKRQGCRMIFQKIFLKKYSVWKFATSVKYTKNGPTATVNTEQPAHTSTNGSLRPHEWWEQKASHSSSRERSSWRCSQKSSDSTLQNWKMKMLHIAHDMKWISLLNSATCSSMQCLDNRRSMCTEFGNLPSYALRAMPHQA